MSKLVNPSGSEAGTPRVTIIDAMLGPLVTTPCASSRRMKTDGDPASKDALATVPTTENGRPPTVILSPTLARLAAVIASPDACGARPLDGLGAPRPSLTTPKMSTSTLSEPLTATERANN